MSSILNANTAMKVAPKNPALVGVAIAAGLFGVLSISQQGSSTKNSSTLEQQFGTADGYFPSATKGASLSKLPGNREHMVGKHYAPVSERRTYRTKRVTKKFTSSYDNNTV
jgi:hypothetical protein